MLGSLDCKTERMVVRNQLSFERFEVELFGQVKQIERMLRTTA